MPLVFQTDYRLLFVVNVLTAFCYAFVLPVMTVFLVEGLGIAPSFIGLYTVALALSGIVVAQWFGRLADKGISAKTLFMIGIAALMAATFAYAWLTSFWSVLLVGIMVMSVGTSAVPMLLTLIRHRINHTSGSATSINAQMRAGVSLVWVLGPAFAFFLVGQAGFKATFLTATGCCVVVLFVSLFWLPSASGSTSRSPNKAPIERPRLSLFLLALGGSMAGTTLAGILGQYVGFHQALLGSFGLATGALVLLWLAWLTRNAGMSKDEVLTSAAPFQVERPK